MEHTSLIDPKDPPQLQVQKQAKIIDALLRRSLRQHKVGQSAYAAFQSAVALQEQVWAKTRDLERASSELETLRYDRERNQKTLADALSVLQEGFALFTDGRLEVCNDLFRSLLPDVQAQIRDGLELPAYFDLLRSSRLVLNHDGRAREALAQARALPKGRNSLTFVIGLAGDRWYQVTLQRTSSDNQIILQTDITDIVRRAQTEKRDLIDMHAHYMQAAFDHMSSGVATLSAAGELQVQNDRFRDLLGLPVRLTRPGTPFGEILGFIRNDFRLQPHDVLLFDDWQAILRNGGQFTSRLRHDSGRILRFAVNTLPDRGYLVDIADMTAEAQTTAELESRVEARTADLTAANQRLLEQSQRQARVEEELRHAKELAEEAVSSKTRFLAAASHDLLQPANAAKLLLSTLADRARDSDLADMVERLRGSFSSMESLLGSMLDISRLDSTARELSPEPVCLGPLMRQVAEDQAALAAEKGVTLRAVPCSAWVQSDRRYMLRSIQNLVVNAIQYTEPGGRVLLGAQQRAGQVVLQVWDTGIGIGLEDQQTIFEEFTRAENALGRPGMGLGLSIVDRTCRLLGHRLGVRSTPGTGSVFSIGMDRIEPPAPQEPVVLQGGEEEADLDLLILVVENDPNLLFATVQVLEGWGASVFGTCGTAEALEVIGDIGIPPDLILADYHLDDGATGLEAIRAVREAAGVAIPALVLTADRSPRIAWQGRSEGFEVLNKPVELARLRALIAARAAVVNAPLGAVRQQGEGTNDQDFVRAALERSGDGAGGRAGL